MPLLSKANIESHSLTDLGIPNESQSPAVGIRRFDSGNGLYRRYDGRWSFLLSARNNVVPHVAARETHQRSWKFRSSPQKDFCNNICHERKYRALFDNLVSARE
jgi:hypothetical protein